MMINNTFIEKKDNTVDIIKSYERKQYFTEVYGHRPLDFRLIKSILIDVYHMNNVFYIMRVWILSMPRNIASLRSIS